MIPSEESTCQQQAPRVLGVVTNTSGVAPEQLLPKMKKSRKLKNIKKELMNSKSLTPIKEETNQGTTATATPVKSKSKVFKYAQWRNLEGSLRLTETTLFFKPHPCTSPRYSKTALKRLSWDQIENHQVRTIELNVTKKYLLKLNIRKNARGRDRTTGSSHATSTSTGSSSNLILRFSNPEDLHEIDQEIQKHLLRRGPLVLDDSKKIGPTYYPIVRLNSSIPGSLTLEADQFVFEPLTSEVPVLPAMKVEWDRVEQHQRLFRNQQALLKLKCTKSFQPVIFQMSSLQESKRLHQDVIDRLDHYRYGYRSSNNQFKVQPIDTSTGTGTSTAMTSNMLLQPLLDSSKDIRSPTMANDNNRTTQSSSTKKQKGKKPDEIPTSASTSFFPYLETIILVISVLTLLALSSDVLLQTVAGERNHISIMAHLLSTPSPIPSAAVEVTLPVRQNPPQSQRTSWQRPRATSISPAKENAKEKAKSKSQLNNSNIIPPPTSKTGVGKVDSRSSTSITSSSNKAESGKLVHNRPEINGLLHLLQDKNDGGVTQNLIPAAAIKWNRSSGTRNNANKDANKRPFAGIGKRIGQVATTAASQWMQMISESTIIRIERKQRY
ncbi:expressed unknown protein [Seminavis robusta]|uniref:Uncharacterized protein n=1 Tax=Seminavis robusta TaxID=568900 RepID=A0A9N8H987_9STRA|nr:expressed unknown protein [Seminavis robusta]|eukprot:Sro183_g079610.1 n/a (608) ;mRNA; r:24766-26589